MNGTRKEVIVCCGYYPPSGESGARRPYNLVRELRRRGHEVTVCALYSDSPDGLEGDHGEIVRVVVGPLRAAQVQPDAIPSQRTLLATRLLGFVRQFRALPDRHVRAASQMVRLLSKLGTARSAIVYVTGPPWSVVRTAARFAVRQQLPVVLELRDPWRIGSNLPELWPRRALVRRQRMVALEAATQLVAVSERIAASLRVEFPGRSVLVARNGIPDDLLVHGAHAVATGSRAMGRVVMLYLGEFYLSRDPAPILAGLGVLRRAGRISPATFELRLVGDVKDTPTGPTMDLLREHGLLDCTTLIPRVPFSEARRHLEEADIFLLLAQRQPDQVPNKLYEYFAFQRPIVTIADDEGETAELIRLAGQSQFLVSENATAAEIEAVLHRAMDDASTVGCTMPEAVNALRTSQQLAPVVTCLEALASTRAMP